MIFILNEQVLNGTVTMSNVITGIEAENFIEACKKLKTFKSFTEGFAEITKENHNEINFKVTQDESTSWTVFCEMKNQELKIL
jgi:hypothetical protein